MDSTLTNTPEETPIINSERNESKEVIDEKQRTGKDDIWKDVLGSGCIMKKIIHEGIPDTKPQRLQTCCINYTCTLEDGTVIEEVDGMEIFVGDSDVIQGLDFCIGIMNVGEQSMVKVAPLFAYGDKGLSGKIPGKATLIFNIELKALKSIVKPENISIQERKLIGNRKRERGNWWYGRNENHIAIHCYQRALQFLTTTPLDKDNSEEAETGADLEELMENRITVFNNLAAAQIKVKAYDEALKSLEIVLRDRPHNIKALFRKAFVYRAKNNLVSAVACLQKAKELAPTEQDVQRELNELNKLMQKEKEVEKELARRMFNESKTLANHNKKTSKAKIGIWMTIAATLALGAGVVAYKFIRLY